MNQSKVAVPQPSGLDIKRLLAHESGKTLSEIEKRLERFQPKKGSD